MNAKRSMDRATMMLIFSLTLMTLAHAFVAPSQRVQYRTSTSLNFGALPEEVNPFLLANGLSAATRMGVGYDDLSSASSSLSSLRTFFIVITAAIFGITAVAYLTAAIIVPKAAEQLERDCKRLRPELWEEYEAKLDDGETMVNRPDLLQDLGNIMQPIIAKDYESEAAKKFDNNDTP